MMKDQFLLDARPQLRTAFVEDLYARIERKPTFFHNLLGAMNGRRSFATVLLLFLLFSACARLLTSPDYHLETTINGIHVYEINYKLIPKANWAAQTTSEVSDDNDSQSQGIFSPSYISLDELIDRLPYTINLPTWVPEGFEGQEKYYDSPSVWEFLVHFNWSSEATSTAFGIITRQVTDKSLREIQVAPGKWELVEINGVKAVFVKGQFAPPFTSEEEYFDFQDGDETYARSYWDDNLGYRLVWIYEGTYYELNSPPFGLIFRDIELPFSTQESISQEDLFRIAESMIPEE